MNLTPAQHAAMQKLAQRVVVLEPQDRTPAILTIVDEYTKSLRAEHPDLSEAQLERVVYRFGTALMQELHQLDRTIADEGHA